MSDYWDGFDGTVTTVAEFLKWYDEYEAEMDGNYVAKSEALRALIEIVRREVAP